MSPPSHTSSSRAHQFLHSYDYLLPGSPFHSASKQQTSRHNVTPMQCSVGFERRNCFNPKLLLQRSAELQQPRGVSAIPVLTPDSAKEQSGAIGNPTASSSLAVLAHGTSELISYLKYPLLNNSEFDVSPKAPCHFIARQIASRRKPRRKAEGLREKTPAPSHTTASL